MQNSPLHLRISFAASGAVGGIISNGVAYFLLLYYSQVLGLDPALAGLAMLIALCVDAVSDPLIGWWSDRFKHRFGRRHPFLFASILPIPIAYYYLWDAPELPQSGLFAYMLVLTIFLRLVLTAHVVPFRALLPELTEDYDARTRLMNDSNSSGWFFGTIMTTAMYGWWLADSAEYPDGAGILRAAGYVEQGLVAGILVLFCLCFATFATRRYAGMLSAAIPWNVDWRGSLQQVRQTLSDRSVLGLVVSGLLAAMGSGTSTTLWAYLQSYFWSFDTFQIAVISAAQVVSAVIAFYLLPYVTSGRDKKTVYAWILVLSVAFSTGPVLLSVLGLFFAIDSPYLFPVMVCIGIVEVTLWVMTGSIFASMIADVTEHRALITTRREEGLLFSAQSFVAKVAGGVGVWTGGVMLAVINFPSNTASVDMGAEIVSRLGWVYAPAVMVFYLLSIWVLRWYEIDRRTHARNLADLRKAG